MTLAMVFDRYGPPDVLRLAELPAPQAGPGQVRVRVKAAGVVDQVGDGVTNLAVGDEMLGSTMLSGYAQHVVVAAENAVAKPPELDFPNAAALVAASQTASGALDELNVGKGDTLLVHAAAGSVGTIAVQLGRLRGATVIGTASPPNHDYLRELDAIPVAYGDGLADRVRGRAPDRRVRAQPREGSPDRRGLADHAEPRVRSTDVRDGNHRRS